MQLDVLIIMSTVGKAIPTLMSDDPDMKAPGTVSKLE